GSDVMVVGMGYLAQQLGELRRFFLEASRALQQARLERAVIAQILRHALPMVAAGFEVERRFVERAMSGENFGAEEIGARLLFRCDPSQPLGDPRVARARRVAGYLRGQA